MPGRDDERLAAARIAADRRLAAVAISTAGIGAIGPTSPAYAVAVPLESVARTVSPSVLPTSRETSV